MPARFSSFLIDVVGINKFGVFDLNSAHRHKDVLSERSCFVVLKLASLECSIRHYQLHCVLISSVLGELGGSDFEVGVSGGVNHENGRSEFSFIQTEVVAVGYEHRFCRDK